MASGLVNVDGDDALTVAVNVGRVEYLRPVLLAVSEFACSFGFLPSGREPFEPTAAQPYILIVGDDTAAGPNGFHQESLRRFVERCGAAAIVAVEEPPEQAYIAASAVAAVTRKSVLIVETGVSQEGPWHGFILGTKPGIAMTVWTAPALGMLQ